MPFVERMFLSYQKVPGAPAPATKQTFDPKTVVSSYIAAKNSPEEKAKVSISQAELFHACYATQVTAMAALNAKQIIGTSVDAATRGAKACGIVASARHAAKGAANDVKSKQQIVAAQIRTLTLTQADLKTLALRTSEKAQLDSAVRAATSAPHRDAPSTWARARFLIVQ